MLRGLWHGAMVAGLTLVTQIGGLAWVAALILRRGRRGFLIWFLGLYMAMTIGARLVAPDHGRVAIGCWPDAEDGVATPAIFCLLNRTYVSPELADLIRDLAHHMEAQHPGSRVRVLDAGFPFFDGFPLLPHLSHDDGDKVDLAFWYQGDGLRSPLGYWAFEALHSGEDSLCAGQSKPSLRWNMAWFQRFVRDLPLDETRTAEAIIWLKSALPRSGKILIEPHLAKRLGVAGGNVRFQGCRAARHDDHIHIQL